MRIENLAPEYLEKEHTLFWVLLLLISIIAIYTKHKDEKINNAAVEKLAYELVAIFGNRVLGPDNPPVGRMQGLYVKKIMLKIENEVSYKRAKNRIAEIISSVLKQFKTVNIVVDVDPM